LYKRAARRIFPSIFLLGEYHRRCRTGVEYHPAERIGNDPKKQKKIIWAPRADLALADRLAHEWSALTRC
jgi:hypothetical protein